MPPRIDTVIEPVGFDIGVKRFGTLSDGEIIESPMPYRKAKTKLGQLQYRNRHKQLGNRRKKIKQSNNAKKYRQKLSKKHYKVTCQRKDFLQKTTTNLCRKYAHLKIENLNISGMMSNHKLASAVADLGAYEFKRQLSYKAEWYANRIDIIDQWFPSSKKCCECGHLKEDLKLSDRMYECSNCGLKIDRDLNASINLKNADDDVIVEKIGWVTSEFYACGQ